MRLEYGWPESSAERAIWPPAWDLLEECGGKQPDNVNLAPTIALETKIPAGSAGPRYGIYGTESAPGRAGGFVEAGLGLTEGVRQFHTGDGLLWTQPALLISQENAAKRFA